MPSVSVLPSSSSLSSYASSGSTHINGSSSSSHSSGSHPVRDLTVAEIKDRARASEHDVRGATLLSILRAAKDKEQIGLVREQDGDIRGAFQSLVIAAQLAQVIMNHSEFKQEKKRSGPKAPIYKECLEFQTHFSTEVIPKVKRLETRLLEMEQLKKGQDEHAEQEDSEPSSRSLGSIADRMRSLQNAGLKVQTTKRLSRDLSVASPATASSMSPLLPDWKERSNISSTSISRSSSHVQSPTLTQSYSQSHSQSQQQSLVSNHPTGSSVHSTSSLGPPSPSVSTDSPRFATLSEFTQAFPSIDELDEGLPSLPSVPHNLSGASSSNTPPISPSVIKRFPSLPLDLDPGPRPASTPIPPSMSVNGLQQSRPASPTSALRSMRSPLSPVISPKPIGLTFTGSSSSARASPLSTGDTSSHATTSRTPLSLPVTSAIYPKTLREYLSRQNEVMVLLLDVRTRAEFAKAHIKAEAVVCLEPQVLHRDGLTSEKLEDAFSIAPQKESAVFRNRDKFDLVVMYDGESENLGSANTPMSLAMKVIFENAFQRVLKRPPVILVGGLKAWRTAYPTEVARDESVTGLGMDLDRISLASTAASSYSSPAINGSTENKVNGWGAESPLSPSQEIRSTTRHHFAMDQIPEDESSSLDNQNTNSSEPGGRRLTRKPTMSRPPSSSCISFNSRNPYEKNSPYMNGSLASSSSSITYPQYPLPSTSNFGTFLPSNNNPFVSPPPTASINPKITRRHSDYIDQSEQAVSSFNKRSSIDYPDITLQHVIRPPPAATTSVSERQDPRRSNVSGHRTSMSTNEPPRPPTIESDYPVVYWPDMQVSTSGLKNLGNTCYMNSTMQCLSATVPFSRFFTDGRYKHAINYMNPLGTKGKLTEAFASILHEMWHQETPIITPFTFRRQICAYAQQFSGSEQHDSQEFLNFLLDGLHEDLNRVLHKENIPRTPESEAELEHLPQQIASQQEWSLYRRRDNSIVVDFFMGQFRNRMQCLTCQKTSTTYNSFMYLTLPIPRGSRVTLQHCLDAFVQEEVMEKADAWQCPNCKTLRKATKRLSISRLPPVLLIHLKRFQTKGHFTDKLETFVDFPLKGLDLTNYMPSPLPPGVDTRKVSQPISLDDPRSQVPPYKYDLYAVTNHFGTLSSGHYTAFVNSQRSWLYCDDSRITQADSREVVGKPAYVLYYKRVKP